MFTDIECAQASARVYRPDPGPATLINVGEVVGSVLAVGGEVIVAMRGTADNADVLADIDALPATDPELGQVHAGFLAGVDAWLESAQAWLTAQPVTVTGHSLGGARARIIAGKMLARGWPVAKVCTFGSPRPAFQGLADMIARSGIAHVSYRHGGDPVPQVPLEVGGYRHTEAWIQLGAVPLVDKVEDHHVAYYVAAVAGLATARA